jgi:hypothetical protein
LAGWRGCQYALERDNVMRRSGRCLPEKDVFDLLPVFLRETMRGGGVCSRIGGRKDHNRDE